MVHIGHINIRPLEMLSLLTWQKTRSWLIFIFVEQNLKQ